MPEAKPVPLDFQTGIIKTDAPYDERGRYVDCDNIRFANGRPETYKGWLRFGSDVVTGIARAIIGWDDNSLNRHLVTGTESKLEHFDIDGVKSNITPLRTSATADLTNPFATTDLSAEVTVEHASHDANAGDTVNYSGATAVAGITINGDYVITEIVDNDHYKILHSSAANATTTGGGSVHAEYEIHAGTSNNTVGVGGYGVGRYGRGTYGTARSSVTFTRYARIWSLDLYGENLLALPSGEALYMWDPDSPSDRASYVANSPEGEAMFITNEGFPFILGAAGNLMAVQWPDQEDITVWSPDVVTNTSRRRVLQGGSRLVAGARLKGRAAIIWSDTAAHIMQYTGSRNFVYDNFLGGDKCGLVGPKAFAIANGVAYWMGYFTFHMCAGSTVQQIPRVGEIQDWLFDRLTKKQAWKVSASYSSRYNEIEWLYMADGEAEPAFYVTVQLDTWDWWIGTRSRSCMFELAGMDPKVFGVALDGKLYEHEVGVDADGAPLRKFLESAPADVENGVKVLDIHHYWPNFLGRVGEVILTLKCWDKPDDETALEEAVETVAQGQGTVDFNASGRQVSFKIESETLGGKFRLGLPRVLVAPAGTGSGDGDAE